MTGGGACGAPNYTSNPSGFLMSPWFERLPIELSEFTDIINRLCLQVCVGAVIVKPLLFA